MTSQKNIFQKIGKYKDYDENGLLIRCYCCEHGKYYGKFKEYDENEQLLYYSYYYKNNKNRQLVIKNFEFKNEFALLKFKDILKNKVRKTRYKLLDEYFISDISNIIASYIFTLSKLNPNKKRILL
jgi:hypothetical protein